MAVGVRLDADDGGAAADLGSASAWTLAAVSPVSSVSSLRCAPHGFWAVAPGGAAGACDGAAVDGAVVGAVVLGVEPEPDAALAMP